MQLVAAQLNSSKSNAFLCLAPTLLGGCKKDEPDPYTALVGMQWNLSYAVYDHYDATGTLMNQWKVRGPWLPVESMCFLRATIENFMHSSRYFHASLPYIRNGDQLSITFPPDNKILLAVRTINRFRADSLTLEVRFSATSGGRYAILKDQYYRQ